MAAKIDLDNDWWKYLILVAFAVLLVLMVLSHEPWYDETKAWVYTQDAKPVALMTKYLRYEGHPALWYLVLMLPAKLHLPLITMNIIAALIAIAACYLFVFRSPFPVYIKVLFPFSFFFFYQFAVVARSYVLMAPLLFLMAMIYKDKTRRTYLFAALLCLLSLVSIHGLIIAFCILVVHVKDLASEWSGLAKKDRTRQYAALAIFLAAAVLVVAQLWSPPDLAVVSGLNASPVRFVRVGMFALGTSMVGTGLDSIALLIVAVSLVWFWRKKYLLLYLLPTAGLLVFFSVKYFSGWHAGILFLVWIFALWVSLENGSSKGRHDEQEKNDGNKEQEPDKTAGGHLLVNILTFKNVMMMILTIVLAAQVYWSVEASRTDLGGIYSASYSVQKFIKEEHLEDGKVYYVGSTSISSVLAYFDRNIFRNYRTENNKRFDIDAAKYQYPQNIYANLNPESVEAISRDKPDYVIVGGLYDPKYEKALPEYKLEYSFYGQNYNICTGKVGFTDGFLVFRRSNV